MTAGHGGGGRSRVVFVGNIPYDMTEEQLVDIFKEVGPVISFRLMFDRETGKARGFGFCEYADPETAASAIRNLNGFDVGGRALKVDTADQEVGEAYRTPISSIPPTIGGISGSTPMAGKLGTAGPMATNATPSMESINTTLSSLSPSQLLEIINQIKNMATSNPEQTRQLLNGNPSLTYAIFHAMILMNLVDSQTVHQIMSISPLQSSSTGVANTSTATGSTTIPSINQSATAAPTPAMNMMNPDQQRALIMQIMNLTPEQIDSLPPSQRDQVLQVRAQLGAATTTTTNGSVAGGASNTSNR